MAETKVEPRDKGVSISADVRPDFSIADPISKPQLKKTS